MLNQIFYTNVLCVMKKKQMTKFDLANKSDVSLSFISDLTRGKANPSLRIIHQIADALEMPLPTLLETTDSGNASLTPVKISSERRGPNLPPGYERVTAVLPDFQAYQVKVWGQAALKKLGR